MSDGGGDAHVVRLRLDVAYDGGGFSGWASQPGRRTVQQSLEDGLRTVLRLPQARLTVAGRTDAGVHARGQVCHVDLPSGAVIAVGGVDELTRRLGRLLPDDVRVRRTSPAPVGFDARFSAMWRRYAYRLCDSPPDADPLTRHQVLAWPRGIATQPMNEASALLLGEHDFAAFCRRRAGATTIRALRELRWSRDGSSVTARVVADAFCHSMVRSLVGCLLAVGEGRQPVTWPRDVLLRGVRDPQVRVVEPHGLTLEEVGYPPDDALAARASEARSMRTLA